MCLAGSTEEYQRVNDRLQATEVQTRLTTVALSKDGKNTVQLRGPAGSVPRKADIQAVGADAPLPIEPPYAVQRRFPCWPFKFFVPTYACQGVAGIVCFVTANPRFLLAMLLGDLRKMVFQIRGALAYNTKVKLRA